MFIEENLETLCPGLTPFPDNVFVDDQPWLADHLWPSLSIDLGMLRPELAGTVVHMLQPVGPIDGYIGEGTVEFHDEFTAPNWFALHLTEDNRYRFLGPQAYFDPQDDADVAASEAYRARVRAHAMAQGRLADFPDGLDGEADEKPWLDRLGGEFWAGNWLTEAPPDAFELVEDEENDVIELSYRGQPFFPVACANGLTILMFYEPDSRTVLFTFDES